MRPWATLSAPKQFQTKAIIPIAAAHERNVRRVSALTIFPVIVVNGVTEGERAANEVEKEFGEHFITGKLTQEDYNAKTNEKLQERRIQRQAILDSGGQGAHILIREEFTYGLGILDYMLSNPAIIDGAEAWLAAQITGIWTAFESLSEELWQAVLNAYPHGLAELKGTKKGLAKGDEDKNIPLHLLQKFKYDLSQNMGTILKVKYSFDRLEDIRRAYGDASFEKDPTIHKIIGDKSLDALALVRNVIVHNGGIVDEAYEKRKGDVPPAAMAKVGDPVLLDGEMVANLIEPVIRLSWNLVIAVDEWLAARDLSQTPLGVLSKR
jgi:hypothetical protein